MGAKTQTFTREVVELTVKVRVDYLTKRDRADALRDVRDALAGVRAGSANWEYISTSARMLKK